jgi:general secretion pathway protein E/type IV pilus assembly protein PilB
MELEFSDRVGGKAQAKDDKPTGQAPVGLSLGGSVLAAAAPAPITPPSVEPPPPAQAPAVVPANPPPAASGNAAGMARIGDKLVEMGLISKDQLQVALYEKKRSNKLMGNLLVDLGFITEQALSTVLAESSGFERFDPKSTVVDPELIKRLPKEMAQRCRVLPVSLEGEALRLAMADIYDVLAIDQARRYLPAGVEIIPLVCSESELTSAIDQYYGYEFSIDGILRELETGNHDLSATALSGDGYVHPLVRLVNAILFDAVKTGASDIHFEPEGSFLRLRYRIDGVLTQIRTVHKDHWAAISHRLKIISGMNIADKLNPQDGRFSLTVGQRHVDFRVAALPTVHGENLVVRILDRSGSLLALDQLGFSGSNRALLERLLKRPEGIILATGPTGSGKTTTLYAILTHINSLERNIMTLEDPVEYALPLIRQAQVREGTSLTFSEGVRALLRQDPDVIFIGEVRDQATASMALRAAMTGHQVYSTLHANDAAGALPRLHDLGLHHGLLAGNVIGIIAQRLVRRLCTACATTRTATAEECRIFGVDPGKPPKIGHAVGCPVCRHTGYKGRIAVQEILPMNPELDEMVIKGASLAHLRKAARDYGFVPMAEDGIAKVLAGIVSLESLMRSVDVTERL